jgi:hypothetical protein
VATSSGPQKAQFDRCELDKEQRPVGNEYGGTPKLAPQPKRLTLPAGKQNDNNIPQEKLN